MCAACAAPGPREDGAMRLLLIEDSVRLCESLRLGLEKLGFAVDMVHEGSRGLSYAANNPYDVIVLDIMLPGMDGIEVLRNLRERGCDTHVIMLTARDRPEDRVRGLDAGADDYLPKPFEFDELVARIRALLRRRYGKKDPIVALGSLELNATEGVLRHADELVPLSPREFSLLEFLTYRKGEVVTRIEIEDAIYGEHTLPNGNAVDSAVCRLRAKLSKYDGAPRIETRRHRGYVLVTG